MVAVDDIDGNDDGDDTILIIIICVHFMLFFVPFQTYFNYSRANTFSLMSFAMNTWRLSRKVFSLTPSSIATYSAWRFAKIDDEFMRYYYLSYFLCQTLTLPVHIYSARLNSSNIYAKTEKRIKKLCIIWWEDNILNSVLIPIVNVHGLVSFLLYLPFAQTDVIKIASQEQVMADELKRIRKRK